MGDKHQNVYRQNPAKPVNHGCDMACFHDDVSGRAGWFTGNSRKKTVQLGATLRRTSNLEFVAAPAASPSFRLWLEIPDFNPRFSSSVSRDYPGPSSLEPSQRKTQRSSERSSEHLGRNNWKTEPRAENLLLAGQRSPVTQTAQVSSGGGLHLRWNSAVFPSFLGSLEATQAAADTRNVSGKAPGTNVPASVSAAGRPCCTPAGGCACRS